MQRHKALHSLSHDHHHGLILAQLIKTGSPEYQNLPKTIEGKKDYSINFYNNELVRHFNNEENILFPVVEGRDNEVDSLFKEIINEHREIKNLINKLESGEDVENTLDKLGYLLESHIRKEERKLFMMVQEILTGDELNALEVKLNSSGNSE